MAQRPELGHSYVIVTGVTSDLVPTGIAAKAIGVDRGTLVRWWQAGTVTPALVTPGGHARWDLDDLRAQLRDQQQRGED